LESEWLVSLNQYNDFDVVVVGGGASGSLAVSELCSRGLKVALIDAGEDFRESLKDRPSEPLNYDEFSIQSNSESFNPDTSRFFVNDRKCPYETDEKFPFYWIRSHAPGGRLRLWKGLSYRMSDLDFKASSRDSVGIDWPLCYSDRLKFISGWFSEALFYVFPDQLLS